MEPAQPPTKIKKKNNTGPIPEYDMKSPEAYPVVVIIATILKIYCVILKKDISINVKSTKITVILARKIKLKKKIICGSDFGIFRVKKMAIKKLNGKPPSIINIIDTHKTFELW